MTRTLTITKFATVELPDAENVVPFAEVKSWVLTGRILRHLLRYQDVRLRTQLLELLPRPLLTAFLIRGLSRGRCVIEDEFGNQKSVGLRLLAQLVWSAARDLTEKDGMLADVEQRLARMARSYPSSKLAIDLKARPLYLRSDLVFGLTSGGSVGHVAGVVNNLDRFTAPPIFATTDRIPTVAERIETWLIRPDGRFREFAELPSIAFNRSAAQQVRDRLGALRPAFIYQRYSMNNFTGAELASEFKIPLVLEYNGSEIWVDRVWGEGRLKYEALSAQIEGFNLDYADLVVVISDAIGAELAARGINPEKVLVNPNGVDVNVYRPDVDGAEVRRRLGLDGMVVIGFIGTFGPWHGAEVLAEAFAKLLRMNPDYRSRVRLLMIGDGNRLAATQRVIDAGGGKAETIFVGRTRQADGPAFLAACDILASPHVPNADGSRFFGSPTKLFEYMAMGKGIVASRLEQIGEVLEHDRTAWLVEPASVDELVEGLRTLIDEPALTKRLGTAARAEVVAKYTWEEHTKKIIERLEVVTRSS